MANPVHELYGNRVRLRACGVCIQQGQILLVNHRYLTDGDFWAPPGGGVSFGEGCREAVAREFDEETGVKVEIGDFLFACELVKGPLHAVELFFLVHVTGGRLARGSDPESGGNQIIKEVKFLSQEEIKKLPANHLHGIFRHCSDLREITSLRGYFKL